MTRHPRALAVAAVSAALLLGGLAPADALPPEPVPFGNGTATATAVVTKFTPGVGSFPTGLAGGVAITNVTNAIAQAQAETLDLGLIGLLLTALDVVDGDDIPEPLFVDNRAGDTAASSDEYPIEGTTLGGGRKEVRALQAVPTATATSTLVSAYSDAVAVEGGRAESVSEVIPGRARQGRASVTLDVEIAGLVKLSGLRWDVLHRTGEGARSDGTFGLSAASIAGVPIPLEPLAGAEAAINAALAPTGLSIQLPRVEHLTDPVDLVRVTSLRILFKDSPLGNALFGPALGLTRTQREQLFTDLTKADDLTVGPLLAAEVATAIMSGSGFLAIELGGAQASSGPLLIPDVTPEALGPGALPTLPSLPPLPASGAPPSRTVVRAPAAVGPLEDRCESAHVLHPVGCSRGLLLPVGLAGLAAAIVIGALDIRRQRRLRPLLAAEGVPIEVGGVGRRALRSYGPVVAAGAALAVLAASVGVPRVHLAYEGAIEVPDPGATRDETGVAGDALQGGDTGGTAAGTRGSAVGAVRPCASRDRQVPQDPYSPPCYEFTGGNGGATSPGVTGDTITVAIRAVEAGSATEIFSALGGQDLEEPTETGNETAVALAEYFSKNFQFYGRKLKLEFFDGDGNGLEELLSGGKEAALADATKAAQELHAFADVGAITIPYADALAQNRVINIGSPYPSQEWYETRRPYSWSVFSDGTNLVSATSSAMIGRFPPGSRAEHAGPALRDKPRRFAIVAPENAEYQESMNVLIARLRAANIEVVTNQKYKLDLVSFPNQASNIIAQIKDAGVTSVVCICDPAMLAYGLTLKANEQDYEPEWITAGIVFVEQDVVAQLIDARQWSHAFGTAYNAYSEPFGASFPYYAYKSVRPVDEPVRGVEEIYYMMYLLAIGIQMAGPNLTPETFEAGMFAYPDRFGPRGTWDFGPGDYTPTNDYREIWWDPDRISGQNQRRGAWAQLDNGRRYTPENPPHGRAPYFEEG